MSSNAKDPAGTSLNWMRTCVQGPRARVRCKGQALHKNYRTGQGRFYMDAKTTNGVITVHVNKQQETETFTNKHELSLSIPRGCCINRSDVNQTIQRKKNKGALLRCCTHKQRPLPYTQNPMRTISVIARSATQAHKTRGQTPGLHVITARLAERE